MSLESDLEGLRPLSPRVDAVTEGGHHYFLLKEVALPETWTPRRVNLLLHPKPRDGYESRLYYSERVVSPTQRLDLNWQGQILLFERQWHFMSWRHEAAGLTLHQLIQVHLRAFRPV